MDLMDVTEGRRDKHYEELRNLHVSSNIFSILYYKQCMWRYYRVEWRNEDQEINPTFWSENLQS